MKSGHSLANACAMYAKCGDLRHATNLVIGKRRTMIKIIPFVLGSIFGYTIEIGPPPLNTALGYNVRRRKKDFFKHN